MDTGTLAVIMVFSIPLVAIVGGLTLAALKIWKGAASSTQLAEETRLIQDLNHGLKRLEERIEALETILAEKDRNEKSGVS